MRDTDKYPKKAGIYKLISSTSGKIYIGKSVNIYGRMNYHKNSSNRDKNNHLQNAIKKYGWCDFNVEILEIFEDFDKLKDNDNLLNKESSYIKLYNSNDREIGYNICSYSNDVTGLPRKKMTDETKEKLRNIHIGKKMSDESKLKMSIAKKGKPRGPRSEETKQKLRIANIGRKRTPEQIEQMRLISLGRVHSEETKLKMSKSRIGKKGTPHTEETKEKLRQLNLGKTLSDETKEKIKQSNLGRIVTDETKEKNRQSNLGKLRSEETKERMRLARQKRKDKD